MYPTKLVGEKYEAQNICNDHTDYIRETYSGNKDYYHSVAVVKKGTLPNVKRMIDLRGLKACFAKVGSLAGWTLPIYK